MALQMLDARRGANQLQVLAPTGCCDGYAQVVGTQNQAALE